MQEGRMFLMTVSVSVDILVITIWSCSTKCSTNCSKKCSKKCSTQCSTKCSTQCSTDSVPLGAPTSAHCFGNSVSYSMFHMKKTCGTLHWMENLEHMEQHMFHCYQHPRSLDHIYQSIRTIRTYVSFHPLDCQNPKTGSIWENSTFFQNLNL